MIPTSIHPGQHLKELLDEWGISQSALARHIKVKPGLINEICNGRRGISIELAQCLGEAFGSSVDFWVHLQNAFELGKSKFKPNFGRLPQIKAA